jgi:rfaE bifunctional protein kinase chain/domain
MVALLKAFSKLSPRRVLVAGDLLLDRYTLGRARRISPEAPVAVVHVEGEEQRSGGAGNVILNLLSLGAEVVVLGRVGYDTAGQAIIDDLKNEGAITDGIIQQQGFTTPVKQRIVAAGQQVVRVDYEYVQPLAEQQEEALVRQLPELLADVDAIAISDYGKGTLSPALMQHLIAAGRSRAIPIIADPKGTDFTKYAGTTVLKPNLSEAYMAAGCSMDTSLTRVAQQLLQQVQVDLLMVTCSEDGIMLFDSQGCCEHYTVKERAVRDVTGAGDTVLATFSLALACGLSYGEATELANVAAGIAVEHFGCARVTLALLAEALLARDAVCKVFSEEYVELLPSLFKGRPSTLLAVSLADGLTAAFFEAVITLTNERDTDLVVYITEDNAHPLLVETLAAMPSVSYVVVTEQHLRSICFQVNMGAVYHLHKDQLHKLVGIEVLYADSFLS